MSKLAPIGYYDKACRAVAKARSVDELGKIRIEAAAIEAAAKMAKNKDMEADATAIRLRAVKQLGRLIEAQKATIGLARGGEHGGRRKKIDGVRQTPAIVRPTLAMQGIDKQLAKQARTLSALADDKFESVVADARDKVSRAVRNAVREVEILQERESYRARTEQGGAVADLEALATAGKKYGVICPDFPWPFAVYSDKGKQRSAERHYDTWPLERILAIAPLIKQLAADDCVFLPWAVWPNLPAAVEVITACGFEYKSLGFLWLKTTPNAEVITLTGKGLHWGGGYRSRANTEPVLLGVKGEPAGMTEDVHQVVIAPVTEHSEKPDEVYRRIERLYRGPYLELFARKPRDHWWTWGNETALNAAAEMSMRR